MNKTYNCGGCREAQRLQERKDASWVKVDGSEGWDGNGLKGNESKDGKGGCTSF